MPGPKDQNTPTFRTWANYAVAYRKRYGVWPVWNAKTGGQVGMLVKRLGADEAPRVAAWYLSVNDARVVQACHAIGHLLSAAEAYRTQYLTGRQVTGTTARQIENTQANASAAEQAKAIIRAGGVRNAIL
ncbi:MAG: hypothetical protein LPK85_14540 [Gammaproteobacteria bacterium]|nr:hypothetical protein [Gammaproteobacteria bacterium]